MQLTLSGVGFAYPRARAAALSDVAFDVGPGVTAVVGVNGAGKSTLMRILARAVRPGSGTVTLDGVDIHRARCREIAPRIGLMPQEFSLPAGARVLDSLAYLAWLRGTPAATAVTRGLELLALVGLADRHGDRVSALSGGMVRRLALAQALVASPDVALLDEPTTGLDPEQRVLIRELLADPARRAPITLISSHLMEDVESLADGVILIDAGRVVFAGPLDTFRSGPDGTLESAEAAFLRRLLESAR